MQPGDVVSYRFKVIRKLGGGAYGTVYLVESIREPGREFALKEIVEHDLSPEERKDAVELFRREAKILMGLHHEGLPAVFDAFSTADPESGSELHYLVMEKVDGETLEAKQKRGNAPFPIQTVIPWAIQLAKIMQFLHSQQPDPLIFRDLKPSNVMCDDSGKIWLIDFGIARYFAPGKLKDTYALGTPGFSPPEQYGSGQSDVRSDIFSFGVTLYRLLSFQDPEQFKFKFPPLKTYACDLPDWLDEMVMKCTALNPGDRFQSFSEILQILEQEWNPAPAMQQAPSQAAPQSFLMMVLNPITIPQKIMAFLVTLACTLAVIKLIWPVAMWFDSSASCIVLIIGLLAVSVLLSHMGRMVGCTISILEVSMVLVSLLILSAITVPSFLRARQQGELTACKSNLKNIGTALERYQTDNGKYPSKLEELTPRYIELLPRCARDRKSDYSYFTSQSLNAYTMYCIGKKHSRISGGKENYPQYDSIEGLIEEKH
jgi:Tfp pilus assembly protein PilE